MANLNFDNDLAGLYGDNISCYAQQLSVVTINQYQSQEERVFNTWMDQRTLAVDGPALRSLQSSDQSNYQQYVDQSQRSGGTIPDFYLALVDKYGQIVGDDFSSSIRVTVDTNYYVKDNNTATYTPVLEGNQLYSDYGGISPVQGLVFTGAPGYEYRL